MKISWYLYSFVYQIFLKQVEEGGVRKLNKVTHAAYFHWKSLWEIYCKPLANELNKIGPTIEKLCENYNKK